jgi:hypothetical protein
VPAELLLDRAIDGLLDDRPEPLSVETADLLATAHSLRDSLPRYHPRFTFEEHLARRLAGAARSAARGVTGVSGPSPQGGDAGAPARLVAPAAEAAPGPASHRRRGLLAGGAIASGVSLVIPIAGAALVAWRRGRAGGGL